MGLAAAFSLALAAGCHPVPSRDWAHCSPVLEPSAASPPGAIVVVPDVADPQ
jgi:hypothetical protein